MSRSSAPLGMCGGGGGCAQGDRRSGRLSRDYERMPMNSEALISLANMRLLLVRLI